MLSGDFSRPINIHLSWGAPTPQWMQPAVIEATSQQVGSESLLTETLKQLDGDEGIISGLHNDSSVTFKDE